MVAVRALRDDLVMAVEAHRRLRRGDDRVVAGVASGIADHFGVDPVLVRIAFVVLTFGGGTGIFVYVACLFFMAPAGGEPSSGRWSGPPGWLAGERGLHQALAVGCIVLGSLLLLRNLGVWFSDALVWPVTLAGMGAAILWTRSDAEDRRRWGFSGGVSVARMILGAALLVAGVAVFLPLNTDPSAVRQVLLGMAVTVVGLGLLLGPWIMRLTEALRTERRQRIRSEERAEMAAHLHDSVLQTLALVQRKADQPREVVSLARRQERELRAWLYGDGALRAARPTSLAAAIRAMAAEVEALHHVEVDVVDVGDCALDDRVEAFVAAMREAVVNAAKHSGAPAVAVYVEAEPDGGVVAWVRDRGKGFDPAAVPDDRKGIAESIRQRVARIGGNVTINSAPGEGTEVELELSRP